MACACSDVDSYSINMFDINKNRWKHGHNHFVSSNVRIVHLAIEGTIGRIWQLAGK